MKKKRAIVAVVAMLLALAVPLNAFAADAGTVEALKAAFNDAEGDVEINITSTITSDSEIVLNSKANTKYTINSDDKQIIGGIKITGGGTVVMNKANIQARANDQAALSVKDNANVTVNGIVMSAAGDGVSATENATVVIDGTGYGHAVESRSDTGVSASGSANVTVKGSDIMAGTGVNATGNASVTVLDGITAGTGDGVSANGNAKVSVEGSITSNNGKGVNAAEGSEVTVTGDINAKTYGVYTDCDLSSAHAKVTVVGDITTTGTGSEYAVFSRDATVNVTGDISSASRGAYVRTDENSHQLIVNGNIDAAKTGLQTAGRDLAATITGNIAAGGNGVEAGSESHIEIKGDINGGENGIYALNQSGVTVTGDVTGSVYGINASQSSKVNVTGNVSGKNGSTDGKGSTTGGGGIYAMESAKVTVDGNVSAGESYGAAGGHYATYGANGVVAEDVSTVSVTGNVNGGSNSKLSAAGGRAGDAIRLDTTANVSVGGDAKGGSADAGNAGAGAKIILRVNDDTRFQNASVGSLTVNGRIVGGSASGTATAGDGVKYDYSDGSWTLEKMPTVTLFKAEAGGEGAKPVAVSWGDGSSWYDSEDGTPDYEWLNNEHNYIVKIAAAANGSVSASKTTAKPGETVTLSVTPNSGYKLGSVSVEGAELKYENGVYSFVMPEYGGVTVSATFTAAPVGPATDDNSGLMLWSALMLASAACFVALKKKKIDL